MCGPILDGSAPLQRPWFLRDSTWGVLPFVYVVAVLWLKLLYFSSVFRQEWWVALPEPFAAPFPYFYLLTATLAALLLLIAPTLLLAHRVRLVALGFLYYIVSLLALADLLHFEYFGCLIPAGRIGQIGMLGLAATATRSTWTFGYLRYFVDIVPLHSLLFVCWRLESTDKGFRARWPNAVSGVVAGCLLAWPTLALIRNDPNGLYAYTGQQGELASYLGVLPYHFLDLARTLTKSPESYVTLRDVVAWFQRERAAGFPRSPLFGIAAGKNVIQISAESLQAFPIGLVCKGRPVTPHLNELARESMVFANFQDETHLGTTSDAEFLTNQSLYPLAAGVVAAQAYEHQWRATAAILDEQGYHTLSGCGAPGGFWRMDTMHRGFGFTRSYFQPFYQTLEKMGASGWISDRAFLVKNVSLMKAQSQPFYAYFLTSTNHSDYNYPIPTELKDLDLHAIKDSLLANYLQSVHVFDEAIGEFMSALKEAGLLETTVLVMYGDHHAFVNNGTDLATLLGIQAGDQFAFWRNQKRIPLFIRLPKGEHAGAEATYGGHLDVAPTILSLLGIEDQGSVMMGQDLTTGRNSLVVFRDGSYVDGENYFVNSFGPIERSRCYSVATQQRRSCGTLIRRRDEAQERLRVSDAIVTGDLIPALRAALLEQRRVK